MDPLFKKASADFDEGGAKGLLLNHLSIDSQGRIVFDSSDDAGDASAEGEATRRKNNEEQEDDEVEPDSTLDTTAKELEDIEEDIEIDIGELGARFFPNLDQLDEQDICPSLKNFDLGATADSMDIPFLKAPEDWRQDREQTEEAGAVGDKSGFFLDDENPAGFEDDDDGLLGNFDLPPGTGFGEGGEAWAQTAAIDTRTGYENDGMGGGEGEGGEGMGPGSFDPETGEYVISMNLGPNGKGGHDDVLSYFDEAMQKNWAGPEHWRIRKIKDVNKPATAAKPRKEKEVFEINFLSPLITSISETIYTPASSNSAITLPKKDWRSKTRNLLPDDKHFNSTQLLRLFLKQKARMGSRKAGLGGKSSGFGPKDDDEEPAGEMDEGFWARKENTAAAGDETLLPQGDYDANFFQDDGLAFPGGMGDDDDDLEFADAQERFSVERGEGGLGGNNNATTNFTTNFEGAFGTQLVTQSRRMRPEYVQYARVAKKVDVRRLKEELWRGMGIEGPEDVSFSNANNAYVLTMSKPPSQSAGRLPTPPEEPKKSETGTLKFTTVMQNLQSVYPKQAMNDISTSYCFICLLHLANEKGLVIEKQEGLMELDIRKDPTAEITVGG